MQWCGVVGRRPINSSLKQKKAVHVLSTSLVQHGSTKSYDIIRSSAMPLGSSCSSKHRIGGCSSRFGQELHHLPLRLGMISKKWYRIMARAQLASSMCQTGPLLENVSTLFDAAVEVFVWAFIQKQDVYYTSMDVYREMILTVTASRTLILYYKMCTKPINSCGKWFSHTQWRYLELSLW